MADKVKEPELLKIGFGVWMSLCVLLCLWFFKTFTTGRSGFQKNLHVIEDGLKKMQDTLELRQRQRSLGYTDDMEDISEFMQKFQQAKYDSQVCFPIYIYITVPLESIKCLVHSGVRSPAVNFGMLFEVMSLVCLGPLLLLSIISK